MAKFILKRVGFSILTILFATFAVFSLSRAAGDPLLLYAKPGGYGFTPEQKAVLMEKLGLDKPFVVQYVFWLRDALKGDFGLTILDEKPVFRVVTANLPATVHLGLFAWVFATVVGVPLGVVSAVKRGTIWDMFGRGFALFGQALPSFWVGIVFVLIFAVTLDWLPSGTRGEGWFDWRYVLLPGITLGWGASAAYMRLTRSAMLEVLDSEFVKLARAKGVSSRTVIWKHAFRNALIQPLTASTLILTGFITGSFLVESIFAWPGMGRMAVKAVSDNDFPILLAVVTFFTGLYTLMNLLTDISYGIIDPRIRYD